MAGPADEIRTFAQEHANGCAKLYAATFGEKPWHEAWTEDSARERLSQVTDSPNFYGLVALRGGEVVGLAFGYRRRRPGGDFYFLDEMCVDSETRSSGVGNWLMARLRQDLAEAGVVRIVLLTTGGGRARHFYEKNGFQVDDNWVLMTRERQPGDA